MDIADKADARIYNAVTDGIEDARRNIANRELQPCGACHYCNSYVRGKQLFCGKECSQDWEKMKGRYK